MRGTTTAAGFVLDVPTIGEAEARRRVLERWSAAAGLYALADGRWLLTLGAPETVRSERAPGVPVGRELTETRHGEPLRHDPAALQRLQPAAWLTVEQPVIELVPLDAAPRPTPVEQADAVEGPDLRGAARIATRPVEVERLAERSGRPRFAGLVLRTPLRGVLGRRHARYLARLVDAFERQDDERALREAIGLGGAGWIGLRLPSRRGGPLSPSATVGAGAGLPWGGSVFDLLATLYREAAERLERQGQIERAAFVYADLLRSPRDAVALLERHGMLALAARLAEGRELDPALVVRLWWKAGERERAIAVARARHAFAAAIQRLEPEAPERALALRAAWVDAERARGDHRAAVEAAWPVEELRARIGADLDAIRALGGRQGAAGLGLALAWREDAERAAEALALIEDGPPQERLALLESLARRPAAGARADRRLVTRGVRALLRDAAAERLTIARGGRPVFHRLRERADPLLRADLPPFPSAVAPGAELRVAGEPGPGAVAIADAVWLSTGLVVAAGEHGLLRLTADGRIAQRWAIASERLVVADHGGALLVAGPGEHVTEFHRLDVVTGRLAAWAALPRTLLPESFDGGVLVVPGPSGLEGIDTTTPVPRVLWSDVGADGRILDLRRSPTHLSAIVDVPLAGRRRARSVEQWTWELPARALARRDVDTERWSHQPSARTTADGGVVWVADGIGHRKVVGGHDREQPVAEGAGYVVSAGRVALGSAGELVLAGACSVTFAGAGPPRLRVHAGVAAVWSDDGRVVCVDLEGREVLANLRTR